MILESDAKRALRIQYKQIRPMYEELEVSLKRDLRAFLHDAGIHVLEVQSRVKDFESLWDKARRKGYNDPLEETEDVCALRVIAHYSSDLDGILEIIKTEFDVQELLDKLNELGPSEFRYRSIHVILTVKQEWLQAPCYRALGGLKAEVQVLTVLSHAWASISHDLWYKVRGVPEQFQRELSELAAALEGVDKRFDALRDEKAQYIGALSEEAEERGKFDVDQELNIDSLEALLDVRYPGRYRVSDDITGLLIQLELLDMSMGELLDALDTVDNVLPELDSKLGKQYELDFRLTQHSIVRMALWLTRDQYWQETQPYVSGRVVRVVDRLKAKLSDSKAE